MSLVQVRVALMSMVAAAALSVPSVAQVLFEEVPSSDVRVGITTTLEGFGFDLQEAHDMAVMVTDGIVVEQEAEVCSVHMVTAWWCEVVNGKSTMRMMRFRALTDCFEGFLPASGVCLTAPCPAGTRPYYGVNTGELSCMGIPANACVFLEISEPVESSCSALMPCTCLSGLDETTCEQSKRCLPTLGTDPIVVPAQCPSCD